VLFLLSLLWALDGLGPDLLPALRHSPMPTMERQAITFALLAVLSAAFAGKRQARWPGGRSAFAWAGIGLLLFAAPVVLATAAQGWVSQLERVAIFSLVPVIAVVLEPHLGDSQHRRNGALLAALVAVAGALCIFPLDVPGTPGAAVAVLAVVVASACAAIGNCLAVCLAESNSDGSLALCAALAAGSAAVAFAATSACTERAQWQLLQNLTQIVWLVTVDVPALMLLVWLLRQMSAARMTTRFIFAPLLTVLAGIALEQPAITTRMILGIALMAAGAGWILLAPDDYALGDKPGTL
jgi:drug/metabolite transporter (DMT)-like permease